MTDDFIVYAQAYRAADGAKRYPTFRGRSEREAINGMYCLLHQMGLRIAQFETWQVKVGE